jgi:hypothetical protein
MRRIALPVSVVAMALVLPAIVLGALPNPSDPTIKPPHEIGGVRLGMSVKDADKAWGKTGDCNFNEDTFQTCSYVSTRTKGSAMITGSTKAGVEVVSIQAGYDDEGFRSYKGPLLKFKTSGGIGLGDKLSRIPKAYPSAAPIQNGWAFGGGKFKNGMYFNASDPDDKRISSILLSNGQQG